MRPNASTFRTLPWVAGLLDADKISLPPELTNLSHLAKVIEAEEHAQAQSVTFRALRDLVDGTLENQRYPKPTKDQAIKRMSTYRLLDVGGAAIADPPLARSSSAVLPTMGEPRSNEALSAAEGTLSLHRLDNLRELVKARQGEIKAYNSIMAKLEGQDARTSNRLLTRYLQLCSTHVHIDILKILCNLERAGFHLRLVLEGEIDMPGKITEIEDLVRKSCLLSPTENLWGTQVLPKPSELQAPLLIALFLTPLLLLVGTRMDSKPPSLQTLYDCWLELGPDRPEIVKKADIYVWRLVWRIAQDNAPILPALEETLTQLDLCFRNASDADIAWFRSRRMPRPQLADPIRTRSHRTSAVPSPLSSRDSVTDQSKPPPAKPSADSQGNDSRNAPSKAKSTNPSITPSAKRKPTANRRTEHTLKKIKVEESKSARRSSARITATVRCSGVIDLTSKYTPSFNGIEHISTVETYPQPPGDPKTFQLEYYVPAWVPDHEAGYNYQLREVRQSFTTPPFEVLGEIHKAVQAGYGKDDLPCWLSRENSQIKLLDQDHYDIWDTGTFNETLAAVHIVVTPSVQTRKKYAEMYGFRHRSLQIFGSLERSREIYDCSLMLQNPSCCFSECKVLGNLRDFTPPVNQQDGSTAPYQCRPLLFGFDYSLSEDLTPRFPCSTDQIAFEETVNLEYCKEKEENFPASMRWGFCGTDGAFLDFHLFGNGFGVRVDIKTGTQIWYIVSAVGEQSGFDAFGNPFDLDDGFRTHFSDTEKYCIEALVLEAGTTIYLRPNTPIAIFIASASIATCVLFYATPTLCNTIHGVLNTFVMPARMLCSSRAKESFQLLSRVLAFYKEYFISGEKSVYGVDQSHFPDASFYDGLIPLLGLRAIMELGNVLSGLGQSASPQAVTERYRLICSRKWGRQLTHLLFTSYDLVNCNYDPDDPNDSRIIDGNELFRVYLAQIVATLVSYLNCKNGDESKPTAKHQTLLFRCLQQDAATCKQTKDLLRQHDYQGSFVIGGERLVEVVSAELDQQKAAERATVIESINGYTQDDIQFEKEIKSC